MNLWNKNLSLPTTHEASFSRLMFWLLVLIIVISQYFWKIHISPDLSFLSWDVYGYYSYLPFNLIYHDPGMTNKEIVDSIFSKYPISSTYYQAFQLNNGNWISSYSVGMSFLYLPFFLLSCLWAWLFGYPVDGFSPPFQIIITIGMLFYFFIGLSYLRKLLLKYFSDLITGLTLLILVLGTNIYHEAFNDGLEPHNVLFAFYCILMHHLDRWYNQPSARNAVLVGGVVGFMMMIRGSEIVAALLVALWGISSVDDFKKRLLFIRQHLKWCLLAIVTALLIFSPQVAHWKYITGDWYFNNYKMAEGFNLKHPNLIPFFFSFKKGVFVYTPAVFVFICALFLKKFRKSGFAWPIILFLVVNTYLISCWLVWWGATSFGSRYFSQSMAVFALPLGFLISYISERKKAVQFLFYTGFSLIIFLNIFQSYQFIRGIIHGDRMTFAYYKKVFLKTSIPDGSIELLEPDLDLPGNGDFPAEQKFKSKMICYFDADSMNTLLIDDYFLDSSIAYSGKHSVKLSKEHVFSPTYRMPMNEITEKDFIWAHVTFQYFPVADLKASPASLIVNMHITGNCRDHTKYRALDLESLPYKVGEWNTASFYYLTPRLFTREDQLVAYVYIRGDSPLFIDNFRIDAFEPY